MSGELHEPGSVVNFWPDPVLSSDKGRITSGVALIVTGKAGIGWTIKTELRRVSWNNDLRRFEIVGERRVDR